MNDAKYAKKKIIYRADNMNDVMDSIKLMDESFLATLSTIESPFLLGNLIKKKSTNN